MAREDKVRFTLCLVMTSDWHVGTGEGRHRSVDRLVERDENDLVYVPAKTLRGILRDAAERLAFGLDNGKEDGPWCTLVDALFGSQPALVEARSRDEGRGEGRDTAHVKPTGGRLVIGDAELVRDLRTRLIGPEPARRLLRAALTFIKPGVAIDPRSGRAKEDFLRFEEVARGGAVLGSGVELNLSSVGEREQETVAAFLVAAAALVERLGGKRRRGLGRCELALEAGDGWSWPTNPGDVAQTLANTKPPHVPSKENCRKPATFVSVSPPDEQSWHVVSLALELRAPVLVPAAVLGNVVTCLDFIPGTFLLPHIARALGGNGGLNRPEVWAEIAAGNIRVLPAWPEVVGVRPWPVPLHWQVQKDEAEDRDVVELGSGNGEGDPMKRKTRCVRNAFAKEDREDEKRPKFEALREGFIAQGANGGTVLLSEPEKIVRTHNVIEDRSQRPDEEVGGVYSYEALAPGQIFRTEVHVSGDLAARLGNGWERKLKGKARIGRARNAG